MDIIEFVKGVKSRPLMYLESKTLHEFYYLIKGFLGAKIANNIADIEDLNFENEFTDFLQKKYSTQENNWKNIIELRSNANSIDAYECFSDNFEEWLLEK